MSKVKLKSFLIFFVLLTLCTCIDPYNPQLPGYDSLLVVEGLITNENSSYTVKLSRNIQSQDSVPEKVSDAVVSVTDELGISTMLINYGDGVYKTDSTVFTGVIGKSYSLHILTPDGKEYESDACTMVPVPDIDSIYYLKDAKINNDKSETHEGISMYLDSEEGNGINNYIRWEYEETWKFALPSIKRYDYVNDSTMPPVAIQKDFCWKQRKSSEILIQSFTPQQKGHIQKVPITFIASDLSDRLTIQYSLLVKQYSVSETEFGFWKALKKVNENSGDIFGSLPFFVNGNVFNVENKEEQVLGYFQVSAVSQKRIDIPLKDLLKLNLPFYHYDCDRIEISPDDYCSSGSMGCVPPTWDQLYQMWTEDNYVFIEPVYDPETRELTHYIFAVPECSDCELSGTLTRPSFWTDLN